MHALTGIRAACLKPRQLVGLALKTAPKSQAPGYTEATRLLVWFNL